MSYYVRLKRIVSLSWNLFVVGTIWRGILSEDKRKGDKPVPDNVKDYLNEAQLTALIKIEGFGWKIKYIRRPLFQEPVVVVTNAEGCSIGILEEDGKINLAPDIETRE